MKNSVPKGFNVQRLRQFLSVFAASLLVAVALPLVAHASVDDFTISNFTGDYYLTKDDPQGRLHIVEHIDLFFNDFNHGILRAIPAIYKGHSLKLKVNKISSDSGAPAQFTTYGDHGNTVLKIGDPNQTVTGKQSYTIDYNLDNVVTFYGDHDELYWDINGDQWRQPFEIVTARIHLPNGLMATNQKCFAGANGNTRANCAITPPANGEIVANTTRTLQPYETLTTVIAMPKGTFAAPTAKDWWRDNYAKVLSVVLPPLLFGGWAFSRWNRYGRDLKGRGVIVPEYGPPNDLSPAEAGVLVNYKLDARDISATIIDMAIRKYIRIAEITEKKILKDKKTYEFELINSDFTALKPHEQKILDGIFPDKTVGEEVKVESLKNKFYTTVQSLHSSMPKAMTETGYFADNPWYVSVGMYLLAAGLMFLAFMVHNWLSLGFILSAALLGLFALLMPRRTAKGVEANDAVKGLKLYMEIAEKERIEMLQSPDSPYAEKSAEPVKTVDLFEKLLPYAIVLGVENEWAKQFEDIYKTPPDWYSGNWTTFNAVYFASSLNNSVSAMSTNFSPPSSSGSSGFGGGGFSGGGGGGGGGGGW